MSLKSFANSTSVLLAILLTPAAHAQSAQSMLFEGLSVPRDFARPPGRAIGSLQLDANVGAGIMSANNVYQDSRHLGGEALQSVLSTTLTSTSETHLVTGAIDYFSQKFRNDSYSDLDIDVAKNTLFGRFVTSKLTRLRLLMIDEQNILGADQADQLNGYTTGTESNRRYEAIFEVDNSKYFANAMWRHDTTDSDSFSSDATSVQEDALDRSERDLIALTGRTFGWGRAFVFAGSQAVRYDSVTDPRLAGRNSDERRYGLGIEYNADKLSGDANIYRFTQEFVSPLIRNVENVWVGAGKLQYAATTNVTMQVAFDRRFRETNIPNVSGILANNLFVGAAVAFSPALYVRLGPNYSKANILGTPDAIERYSLDVEAGWNLSKHFKLLFTSSIFMQRPEVSAMKNLTAQQANAVVTLSYGL